MWCNFIWCSALCMINLFLLSRCHALLCFFLHCVWLRREEAAERVLKCVGRFDGLTELWRCTWRAEMCWMLLAFLTCLLLGFTYLAFLVCRRNNVLYGCSFPNTQQDNQVHKCKNRKVVKAGYHPISMSPHVSSLRGMTVISRRLALMDCVTGFFFQISLSC